MCTVGDPLLDLGWILVCWPDDPDPINAGRELAALGGLPSRTELLAAYADAGGRPTEHLDWYVAMACFKLGDRHRGHLLAVPGRSGHTGNPVSGCMIRPAG